MRHRSLFSRGARWVARISGQPQTFAVAVGLILVWAVAGPFVGFSDTWQLTVNTTTTIVTFLMVFLIQNTQNRDSEAVQVKLDELIRATRGAHLALLDLEELEQDELDGIRDEYEALASHARRDIRRGRSDTGTPDTPGVDEGRLVSARQGHREEGPGAVPQEGQGSGPSDQGERSRQRRRTHRRGRGRGNPHTNTSPEEAG